MWSSPTLKPKLPSLLCRKGTATRQRWGRNFHPSCPDTPTRVEQEVEGSPVSQISLGRKEGRKDRSIPQLSRGSPGVPPCCQQLLHPSEPRGQVREGRPCPPAAMPTHTPLPEPQFPILQHHLQQEGGKHLPGRQQRGGVDPKDLRLQPGAKQQWMEGLGQGWGVRASAIPEKPQHNPTWE